MPFLVFAFIIYWLMAGIAKQEEVHYANLTLCLLVHDKTALVWCSLIVLIYINHWHNNETV